MKDFQGKVAFITGGASGIGLGMAKAFAKAGMKLIIADIRQDHLDSAVAWFEQTGHKVHPIRLDVSDRAAFAAAAEEAVSVHGKVHVLCNNAGVNIIGTIEDARFEDWDWLMSVNLGGMFNGVKSCLPHLKAHGEGGHIVNTSSIAGIVAGPGTGIYSATKFGIRGLSESLRYELAPYKIGVSVLCPGTVATNLNESESIRPRKFDSADAALKAKRAEGGALLARVLPKGMSAEEVGEKVLRGIQSNAFHILPHPEFHDEFRQAFEEILNALPKEPVDSEREMFEEGRRKLRRDAKAVADALS
jgi:NAD(P)-dependent dehydrogenase (short-subunit alcohol dehydrogenase family)